MHLTNWGGQNMEEILKLWYETSQFRFVKSLPFIICRGIWLARNSSLFEDRSPPPHQCASQSLTILKHFNKEKVVSL